MIRSCRCSIGPQGRNLDDQPDTSSFSGAKQCTGTITMHRLKRICSVLLDNPRRIDDDRHAPQKCVPGCRILQPNHIAADSPAAGELHLKPFWMTPTANDIVSSLEEGRNEMRAD